MSIALGGTLAAMSPWHEIIPRPIAELYEIHEWRHAAAILQKDFPIQWKEVVEVLEQFRLPRSDIVAKGGRKSPVALKIDREFTLRGWREKKFDTKFTVDGVSRDSPTHKVDCFKAPIALEIEWNNKDPFFDRDLNNFRLLFDLRVVSVGIIITRADELQTIFDVLGKGESYGQSTTHMGKLLPRIEGGGGGGCPLLVFGITKKLYLPDA
ncbi:MAG: BglII/BstYI family type II restriction endonuclease [Planctomycetota bacterium]